MTWPSVFLVLLTVSAQSAYSESICSVSGCQCEDSVVTCQGTDTEDLVLSPSSLPPGLTSLSISHLSSLQIETNTFKLHVELLTLILDNISTIHLQPFIFSESEYDGFLRTFEMSDVMNLNLVEDSFNNAPQCGNSTFRNISIKVHIHYWKSFKHFLWCD